MNIFNQFIDIIYPPRCHICQKFLWKEKVQKDQKIPSFCQNCFDGFSKITSPLCPICGRPFVSGVDYDHVCEDCLRKRPFYNRVTAPYLYDGGLMKAIHQFKYEEKSYLANSLGPLLASFAKRWLKEMDDCLVMPVPLHPKRLRERGFNQSLLLARYIADLQGTELDFLSLKRVRYTRPQTGLKGNERRKNVRSAFGLNDRQTVKGRNIILVDDVATTGNTLNECARVLKRSGAEKVFCMVLARTAGV
jgi:ComF family protein